MSVPSLVPPRLIWVWSSQCLHHRSRCITVCSGPLHLEVPPYALHFAKGSASVSSALCERKMVDDCILEAQYLQVVRPLPCTWETVLVKLYCWDIECFPRLLRIGLCIIVVLFRLLGVWGKGVIILPSIARNIIWCSLGVIVVVWILQYLGSPFESECVFI